MKANRKQAVANFLVTLILALLLNLVIFAWMQPWKLDGAYRPVFWFAYGALMLAFVLRFVSLLLGRGEARRRDVNAGLPISFTVLVYYGATAVLSLCFMILARVGVRVPFPVSLVTECAVLGFYLISLILNLAGREEKNKVRTDSPLAPLAERIRTLATASSDAVLGRKLKELATDLLTTPDASADLAECLNPVADTLATALEQHDTLAATRAISEMKVRLSNR